jgi:transcriptional regulator with XRE-family HTH domain
MAPANRLFEKRQNAVIERIRALLTEKEMDQRDLANKAGMKDSAIHRILAGDTNLTLRTIARLEHALGTSLISVP